MNKITVSVVIGVVVAVINIIVNAISGNPFFTVILRAIVTALLTSGLVYGIFFVFIDILKVDFSSSDDSAATNSEDGDVDITVDDRISEDKLRAEGFDAADDENIENDAGLQESTDTSDSDDNNDTGSKGSDRDYSAYNSNHYESADDDKDDYGSDGYSDLKSNSKAGSYDREKHISDMLGFDVTPEDMARAIKTKLKRDE